MMCNGFDLKVLVGINYPRDVNNTRVTMNDELDLENFSKGIQIWVIYHRIFLTPPIRHLVIFSFMYNLFGFVKRNVGLLIIHFWNSFKHDLIFTIKVSSVKY